MPTPRERPPRVLLLKTGGTLTMTTDAEGSLGPGGEEARPLALVPELQGVAHIDCHVLGDHDSANLQPSFWGEVARVLYQRYDDYDGFVVTHGTDTMVYTAAAVSLFLQNVGKPIVFTGAQIPLTHVGSDGRANLVDAVRVAVSDLAEVCIVFGSEVLRATRARKTSAFHLHAFESVNDYSLGTIGLSLRLAPHARRRELRRPLLAVHLEPNVARTSVWPGMSPEIVRHLAETHAGLLLEGYGVGTLPSEERSLIPAIREAVARGVPVVLGTQCMLGSTALQLYRLTRTALAAGAIPAMDMTPETALVKLMWALGQSRDIRTVEAIMLRPYVGELELSP